MLEAASSYAGAILVLGTVYYVSKRAGLCPGDIDSIASSRSDPGTSPTGNGSSGLSGPTNHSRVFHSPPQNWLDTILIIGEGFRWVFNDTLSKWRKPDLALALVLLARRNVNPAADIAAGCPVAKGSEWTSKLHWILKMHKYCHSLAHSRNFTQLLTRTGVSGSNIIATKLSAGILRPAYTVLLDRESKQVLLVVRGTHSMRDTLTCILGSSQPHHACEPALMESAGGNGAGNYPVLGYAHGGMLTGARWLVNETKGALIEAFQENPGFSLVVTGHSLGAGIAVLVSMMLRGLQQPAQFSDTTCLTFAPPACLTFELALSCNSYVTSVVNGADIVPLFSQGAMDDLREEIVTSQWYGDMCAVQPQCKDMATQVQGRLSKARGAASQWVVAGAQASLQSCSSASLHKLDKGNLLDEDIDLLSDEMDSTPIRGGAARWFRCLQRRGRRPVTHDMNLHAPSLAASRTESGSVLPTQEDEESDEDEVEALETIVNQLEMSSDGPDMPQEMTREDKRTQEPVRPDIEKEIDILYDDPTDGVRDRTETASTSFYEIGRKQSKESSLNRLADLDGRSGRRLAEYKRRLYPPGTILHLVPIPCSEEHAGEASRNVEEPIPENPVDSESRGNWRSAVLGALRWRNRGRRDISESRMRWELRYDIPREQYGLLRPSRTMISDHFLPSYLTSLNSVLAQA